MKDTCLLFQLEEVWFLSPSPFQIHAEKSHWQGSLRTLISVLPVSSAQERGWGWECHGVPTRQYLAHFWKSTKGETFCLLSSFRLPVSPSDTPQTEEASPAEVVCILKFLLLALDPGYQVNSNLCPHYACVPHYIYAPCMYVLLGVQVRTQTHISDNRSPVESTGLQIPEQLHSGGPKYSWVNRAKEAQRNGRSSRLCSNAPDQGYRHGDIWVWSILLEYWAGDRFQFRIYFIW